MLAKGHYNVRSQSFALKETGVITHPGGALEPNAALGIAELWSHLLLVLK